MAGDIRKDLVDRGECGDSRTSHDSRGLTIAVLELLTASRRVSVLEIRRRVDAHRVAGRGFIVCLARCCLML